MTMTASMMKKTNATLNITMTALMMKKTNATLNR